MTATGFEQNVTIQLSYKLYSFIITLPYTTIYYSKNKRKEFKQPNFIWIPEILNWDDMLSHIALLKYSQSEKTFISQISMTSNSAAILFNSHTNEMKITFRQRIGHGQHNRWHTTAPTTVSYDSKVYCGGSPRFDLDFDSVLCPHDHFRVFLIHVTFHQLHSESVWIKTTSWWCWILATWKYQYV